MQVVETKQIVKNYKNHRHSMLALNDISLSVEKGEFLIITGPSGSGKTTLLSIIAGLLEQDSGEVLNREANNMGILFPFHPLEKHLTVVENLTLPLIAKGYGRLKQLRRVKQLANIFDLNTNLRYFPTEISEGEARLYQILRAMMPFPKLLILDEPFSGVDHRKAVRVMTYLREEAIVNNLTVIVVAHDVRLHPFAHRVIRLVDGKISSSSGDIQLDQEMPHYFRI